MGGDSLPPREAQLVPRSTSTADPPGPKQTCVAGPSSGATTGARASGEEVAARDGHAVRSRSGRERKWGRRTAVTVSQVARRGGVRRRERAGQEAAPEPEPFTSMVRAFSSARFGNVMDSTPLS